MAYLWRRLSPEAREVLLKYRKRLRRPWHRPPHYDQGNIHYHLVGACYEHQPYIGQSPERMAEFCELLLEALPASPTAWCVLPNHYHVLIRLSDIKETITLLGMLHGSTSFRWNAEETARGRKVWHSVSDRGMRNGDHFWATLNYIHHNPVKHGYVDRWTDWPFSSAGDYLEEVGREQAVEIWKSFPLYDYGKGWDD
jgi:putative transposase